jgi:hypothetical protein
MMSDHILDYAIIGGGIAGLYAAHRLLEAGNENLHVFEGSVRWGGRLLTVDMPGLPFRAELGGMRFLDRHLLINNLAHQLGINLKKFDFPADKSIMYLRGCHIRPGEECKYKLDRAEEKSSCDRLVTHAIECALREMTFAIDLDGMAEDDRERLTRDIERIQLRIRQLDDRKALPDDEVEREGERKPGKKLKFGIDYFTARQWEVIKRFGCLQDSKLYDIGFWNLLQHYLSSEGFLFLHDALGYESIVLNWNAAEAMQWFLRDFSGSYITTEEGMQIFPTVIVMNYLNRTGRQLVSVEHKLVEVARDICEGEQVWKLHLQDSSEKGPNGKPMMRPVTVLARQVILALTRNDLQEITFPEEVNDPEVRLPKLLEAVKPQRLFKLFLGYDRVWWNDVRGIDGPSGTAKTDLPIRQVYYWGPEKSTNPEGGVSQGMLMASYSDSHYVDFWEPMLKPDRGYCRIEGELFDAEKEWLAAYGVSPNMVKKAHRQVRMLHPELSIADRIPEPVVALVKDWPSGWHAWAVHSHPWYVMTVVKRPLVTEPLYICGEAFSEDQGWVEGALRSAVLVLEQIGLDPPAITDEEYENAGYSGYSNYIGNWQDLPAPDPEG